MQNDDCKVEIMSVALCEEVIDMQTNGKVFIDEALLIRVLAVFDEKKNGAVQAYELEFFNQAVGGPARAMTALEAMVDERLLFRYNHSYSKEYMIYQFKIASEGIIFLQRMRALGRIKNKLQAPASSPFV